MRRELKRTSGRARAPRAGARPFWAALLVGGIALADLGGPLAQAQTRSEVIDAGLAAGRAALDRGDADAARAAFERVIAVDPQNEDAGLGLAIATDEAGRGAQAVALFDRLAARAPRNPAVRFWRARAAYRLGRFDDAIRDLTEAAPLDPDNAPLYQMRLGDAYYAKGDPQRALAAYQQAVSEGAPPPAAFRGLGNAQYALGRHAEAAQAYTQALSRDPLDGRAALHRAWARLALGEDRAALADLNRAIELAPPSAALFLTRADLNRRLGARDAALDDYLAALDLTPADPIGLYGAARTLLDLDRAAEALPLLERFAAAAGQDRALTAAGLFQQGRAKLATGALQAADADYTLLLRLEPENAPARVNRALARLGLGDAAGAREDLREAVRLAPGDAAAHYALARAALAAGADAEAVRVFRRAETLALREDAGARDADAALARGLTLLALDRPLGAIAEFEAAVAADPTRLEPLERLAATFLQIGRHEEALAAARRLTAASPRNPEGYLLEAAARIALAEPDAARFALDRATDLGGDPARIARGAGEAWMAEARVSSWGDDAGALENAVAAFDTAVMLTENDPDSLRLRAVAKHRLGQLEAARADLDQAIKARPDDPELRFARAGVLKDLGRCDLAIRDYDLGLAARGDNASARATRGRCKVGEGSLFDGLGDILGSWF